MEVNFSTLTEHNFLPGVHTCQYEVKQPGRPGPEKQHADQPAAVHRSTDPHSATPARHHGSPREARAHFRIRWNNGRAPPGYQELRNVIDKLAQFVARNGPEFEKMTMEKQKDNAKFSFLFGGDYFSYYKYRLAMEQQPHASARDAEDLKSPDMYNPRTKEGGELPAASIPFLGPSIAPPGVPPPGAPPPGAPPIEELIQQSLWNLQQQEQHLSSLRQEQVTAAIALAVEQQTQKLLQETQLDMAEFDSVLQPIIDMCTKDAISAGKNWMFTNAKSPTHCELMTSHLRNRITADGAHFELRLHLIYLTNDVLHHCQRKHQKDLLAALQKVVVPIYCTSFLAVEEEKQQKITRLLQLWEKNGYFDEETIQQLQNPALGLGQYQASLITEYAGVVQPIQVAFQQQVQALKAQHEEFVSSLKKRHQPQSAPSQIPLLETDNPPGIAPPADVKAVIPSPAPRELDTAPPRTQEPSSSDLPPSKSACPPFDPNQPPPCLPWSTHEGMWNEQRDPGSWSGGPPRDGSPWNGPGGSESGTPAWNSFDPPSNWGNQSEQPPWGQREPPFPPRMQRPPHFRGPFPPHQQPPPFNQPPPPHNFGRFPPRFMQDEFPPRHPYDRPPYPPPRFDYPQEFPGDMPGPPPHHHPNQRMPPGGMGGERPPWGGSQHPDFGPPPHGFNGHSPHVRHRQPLIQDDPSLVPNVPYFDLPAGLMAPLVKLEDSDYKPLDPKDIRLPPPMPPSDRLLAAVEAFYSPPSHDRPRNSEGWEQNGLYEFFRAKMRARRKKEQEKHNRPVPEQVKIIPVSVWIQVSLTVPRETQRNCQVTTAGAAPGGLGAKEQGIQDPIKGGDVRDKWDQYKGVGVSLDDPYENYRRNKSYNFVARMKAREEGASSD
ncbi:hypothetical protein NQD34_002741 [Periophthalmus magnuspinnatus]|nr:hypothetical protein NQD34_002741 [Periophthalmus magnuspinnatus]